MQLILPILLLQILSADISEESYHIVLDPKERTKLVARVSSPVEKIEKRMGDTFEKDETLLLLESAIFEALLNKSTAEVKKAEAELTSKKALYADHSASQFELNEAEYNLANAKSGFAVAKESYEGTNIQAPYKGKVVAVYFEVGETPKVGEILMETINDETLLARFLVSSKRNLKVGQQIFIKLDEKGETIDAKIKRISPEIDPSSGTVKVEAEIDNKEGHFKAGSSGEVRFESK